MKKILLILMSVLLFSCASAPEKPADEAVTDKVKETLSISEIRDRAYSAMEKALGIKANVAVKQDYAAAEKMFNDAEALDASNPEAAAKAALIFLDAETAFNSVYETASEKKENALNELEKAKEDIKAAEDEAQEAEEGTTGGTE